MEFLKTSLHRSEINVIFTGEKYYFVNSYYGIICIAERDEKKELSNNENNTYKSTFTLIVGNSNCVGGSFCNSAIITCAKRLINKNECRYIKKEIVYNTEIKDLRNTYIKITDNTYN